ncbi:MAG: MraY family glycosyltransferase [Bryobacteraceae bacterium]|nr:MraY family glycosyltransferase [Bryobacteraceae bacterium]
MDFPILAFAAAGLLTLLLTPAARDYFTAHHWLDRPGPRKVHDRPIPRIGGIPIFIAYFSISLWAAFYSGPSAREAIAKLLPGALAIFVAGLVDDLRDLRPVTKLLSQSLAAVIAYGTGLRLENFAGIPLPFWISLPVTVFALLLATNAFNLIDGLDGLCAGLGLISAATFAAGAAFYGQTGLLVAALPLAGALAGFLRYNFRSASVFLGDSGALTIGFLLGGFAILWGDRLANSAGVIFPALAMAVPFADVLLSVIRRALRGDSIFAADRAHIHHRLLDRGLSPRSAVLVLYACAAAASALALWLIVAATAVQAALPLSVVAGLGVWGVRQLRYEELLETPPAPPAIPARTSLAGDTAA